MKIRCLADRDIDDVARIHLEELPDDFCALLGSAFLRSVFYPELFRVSDVKLGIEDEEGTIQGFALFATDAGFLRRVVTQNLGAVLMAMEWRAALRPGFWRYALEILVLLLTPDSRLRGAELTYFAISHTRRVGWLSLQLIHRGFAELHAKGVPQCWLKTLESTPLVVKFYEMAGFKQLKVYMGRVYMIGDTSVQPADLS